VELGEDAHRYVNGTSAAVFSMLRTIVMNLLWRGGHHSDRQGTQELANRHQGNDGAGVYHDSHRCTLITLLGIPNRLLG